jgi:hypothetical protein
MTRQSRFNCRGAAHPPKYGRIGRHMGCKSESREVSRVKKLWSRVVFSLLSLGLLAGAISSGCGRACSGVYYSSGAVLTVHLPPASQVAAPETVQVCRGATCTTATLPGPPEAGMANLVVFSRAEVSATLSLAPGGVRALRIFWTVDQVSPASPHDTYAVTVTDASGAVTGQLSGEVTYTSSMPDGEGCGVFWNGSLSD